MFLYLCSKIKSLHFKICTCYLQFTDFCQHKKIYICHWRTLRSPTLNYSLFADCEEPNSHQALWSYYSNWNSFFFHFYMFLLDIEAFTLCLMIVNSFDKQQLIYSFFLPAFWLDKFETQRTWCSSWSVFVTTSYSFCCKANYQFLSSVELQQKLLQKTQNLCRRSIF